MPLEFFDHVLLINLELDTYLIYHLKLYEIIISSFQSMLGNPVCYQMIKQEDPLSLNFRVVIVRMIHF